MESESREKLLKRIRKLYAMSRESESSPHEAEIALRRCQSLMTRFGIRESDLETSEFGASSIGKAFRSVPSHVMVMSSAVALLHDCICVDTGTIEFRGFSIDAEVASLTYGYLHQVMERSLKMRKNDGSVEPGRSASFEYRLGYALAVLERARRIDQERKQEESRLREASVRPAHSTDKDGIGDTAVASGFGLIVRKLEVVRQACRADLGTGRKRRVRYRSGAAHSAGTADGTRVSLDKQLGGVQQKSVGRKTEDMKP